MSQQTDFGRAVDQFAGNHEFIKYYNKYNRELLLQHFLVLAAAGNEVWLAANENDKLSTRDQQDLILVKYIEWIDKMDTEFPEVKKPEEIETDWWRLMLIAYERKPVSGKSLLRKFKEDCRIPILSCFNFYWATMDQSLSLEHRLSALRESVWKEQHSKMLEKTAERGEETVVEVNWYPKQWYAWLYCGVLGKNFKCFDGALPSAGPADFVATARNFVLSAAKAAEERRASDGGGGDAGASGSGLRSTGRRSYSRRRSRGPAISLGNDSSMDIYAGNYDANAVGQDGGSFGGHGMLLSAAAFATGTSGVPEVGPGSAGSAQQFANQQDTHVYLTELQYYNTQTSRLEKAIALAESFNDQQRATHLRRQLYEHVLMPPPEPPSKRQRVSSNTVVGEAGGDGSGAGGSGGGGGVCGTGSGGSGDNQDHLNQQYMSGALPLPSLHGVPGLMISMNSLSNGTGALGGVGSSGGDGGGSGQMFNAFNHQQSHHQQQLHLADVGGGGSSSSSSGGNVTHSNNVHTQHQQQQQQGNINQMH